MAIQLDFPAWVDAQALLVENAIRARARYGTGDFAAYFIPATATDYARVEIADGAPEGASDVVRFPSPGGMTSNIGFVAFQHIRGGLYDACRRLPVFPHSA
ncbi:MAG: hypothetical protein E5W82_10600 [Mesorhizobium sp.]|nr:MAG: hypothetical protein E5W82_10600 [Mesorhizobium sp.]